MVNRALRALAACRSTWVVGPVLGVVACAAAALALGASAASAAQCPNEQRRQESDFNVIAGEPYSAALPDCRAYEMVSPLYKQGHDAEPDFPIGVPVSPDGETFGFASEGGFSGTENYHFSFPLTINTYLAHRTGNGWITESSFAPAQLVSYPYRDGLSSDFAPDLRSFQASCGYSESGVPGTSPVKYTQLKCATRKQRGESWTASSAYATVTGEAVGAEQAYLGGSKTLSRLFVQPQSALLPEDTLGLTEIRSDGIYEVSGIGALSPTGIRLVNVDNTGAELTNGGAGTSLNNENGKGPLLGDHREVTIVNGTAYHAISESGETVFFTATPTAAQPPEGQQQTVYARIHCVEKSPSPCKEDGNNEWFETVAVSNPSPSTECTESGCPGPSLSECKDEAGKNEVELIAEREELIGAARITVEKEIGECHGFRDATYEGAAADGSKVFFTTAQRLVNGDADETRDLYMYDFAKRAKHEDPLTMISAGKTFTKNECGETINHTSGKGAEVEGVVRTSSDGSHVYFVANGALTGEENKGQGKEQPECAQSGTPNLYGYDTETGELKFVAATGANSGGTGEKGKLQDDLHRLAQTTPDGKYLVFSAPGSFDLGPGNEKHSYARNVYRFDFDSGELTWVSHAAPEGEGPTDCGTGGKCTAKEEKSALIAPGERSAGGGEADVDDWNRAISGCPQGESEEEKTQCPEGKFDGETIIFTTHEKLQNDDVNQASDLYEWHCASPCVHPATEGVVQMISDGRDPKGLEGLGKVSEEGEKTEGNPPFWQGNSGMSASGSDIFFLTHTQLVGQDTDILGDYYDARVNGGFERPPAKPECSPQACQPEEPSPAGPGAATSSVFPAGGNLPPGSGETQLVYKVPPPAKLTRAQELARALSACKKERKKKQRAVCEAQAKRKYGVKAVGKSHAKKSGRRGA